MNSGTILWMGPVSTSNLKSVELPPNWDIVTISQEVVAPQQQGPVALTPTMFRAFAATLGKDPLGALMARSKVSPSSAIVASFSAGHGLLDPLLVANAGDPRLLGVLSADSYYGLEVKPGYLAQAKASIANKAQFIPFWLTTSNTKGGVTIHSGEESVAPFADALGLVPGAPAMWMPPPIADRSLGPVEWLDYGSSLTHVEHATKLAPIVLNGWLDHLEGKSPPPPAIAPTTQPLVPLIPGGFLPSNKDPLSKALLLILGGAIGYYGFKWLLGK